MKAFIHLNCEGRYDYLSTRIVFIPYKTNTIGYYFRTVEEYWEEISAGRRGLMFLQLPPAQREQFKAEHLAEVQELATAQGIWRDGAVHFARGWKRTA